VRAPPARARGSAARGVAQAAALLALLGMAGAGAAPGPTPAPCSSLRARPEPTGLLDVDCRPPAAPAGGELAGAAGLLFGRRLDPNGTSVRALEALPGIGPARAEAIVREARLRPFCAATDLERVPGIGPATRARVAAWIETPPRVGCPPP